VPQHGYYSHSDAWGWLDPWTVHPRHGTPSAAVLTMGILMVVAGMVIWAPLVGAADYDGDMGTIGTISLILGIHCSDCRRSRECDARGEIRPYCIWRARHDYPPLDALQFRRSASGLSRLSLSLSRRHISSNRFGAAAHVPGTLLLGRKSHNHTRAAQTQVGPAIEVVINGS